MFMLYPHTVRSKMKVESIVFAQDERMVQEVSKSNNFQVYQVLSSKPHGIPCDTLLL